jgi:hypothetical protein
MKRIIAIALMCSLSACASMYGKDADSGRNKIAQSQASPSGYDDNYMARVERQAQQRGVVVKWVNPPQAPKSKKDG